MGLSQQDLQKMLERNPQLRVRQCKPAPNRIAGQMNGELADEIKTGKYRNVKVYVFADGFISHTKKDEEVHGKPVEKYDSTKEFIRGKELKLLERSGKIRNLKRQQDWLIQDAFMYQGESIKKITYKADFQYEKTANGKELVIVEDVKPFDEASHKYRVTKDFALKWKLLKAKYPDIIFSLY